MTPTHQQLAKARGWFPCLFVHCGELMYGGTTDFYPQQQPTCSNCSLVPRVAALLAEQEAQWNLPVLASEWAQLKADTQRLTVELENAKRAEADIGLALSAQTEQFQEHMQKWRALKDTSALFRARLNLKHSASHTDATQALCGAPPPYVWDNDSGVFCPACKKVETIERETLERAAEIADTTDIPADDMVDLLPRARSEYDLHRIAACMQLQIVIALNEAQRAPVSHPPDEGEEKL